MSKAEAVVHLTQDQLTISLPKEAVACFQAGYAGHRTMLEKMLEGTEIAIEGHLKKLSRSWGLISHKSKAKLITEIFRQVHDIMKVDGDGPSSSTFNSYRTKISRCMIFHVDLADANWNNRGLAEAMALAMKMKGGTLKERMVLALAEKKEDKNWSGHPPQISVPPTQPVPAGGIVMPSPAITMPMPGVENSPAHLVYMYLDAIVQGGSQPGIRDVLRSEDDPRFKRAYQLYLQAKDMLGDFTAIEKGSYGLAKAV